jgi:hypothetical protein
MSAMGRQQPFGQKVRLLPRRQMSARGAQETLYRNDHEAVLMAIRHHRLLA